MKLSTLILLASYAGLTAGQDAEPMSEPGVGTFDYTGEECPTLGEPCMTSWDQMGICAHGGWSSDVNYCMSGGTELAAEPESAAADCVEDAEFFDEQGYPCSDWNGLVCTEATSVHGYSADGEAALLASCQVSCAICTIDADPTTAVAPTLCSDDTLFHDEAGYLCSDWAHEAYVCAESGYSADGQEALQSACPDSCGACTSSTNTEQLCTDDTIFADQFDFPCADWAAPGLVCAEATTVHGYTDASQQELLDACPVSCELCLVPQAEQPTHCSNDVEHSDLCSYFEDNDLPCSSSGYSDDEQALLLARCPLQCGECTPATSTEELCTDDSVFIDEAGYPCSDWNFDVYGLLCSEAVAQYGYSTEGEAAILAACPLSCSTCPGPSLCYDDADYTTDLGLRCDSFVANPEFCALMVNAAHHIRSCPRACAACTAATATATSCTDDSVFVDELGQSCAEWSSSDCSQATSLSDEGQAALISACPLSCGTCTAIESCTDNDEFVDEQGYACHTWSDPAYACENAVSAYSYSEDGQAALIDNCHQACGVCSSSGNTATVCTDDSVFTDAAGYSCADWAADEQLVCTEAVTAHSYSTTSMETLIAMCPLACEQCNEYDGCHTSPCFEGVLCHDDPNPGLGFRCDDCPDGYSGDGQACEDIDDCDGNPCTFFGFCSDTGVNSYDCACDAGYIFNNGETCTEIFNCDSAETNDCDTNAVCNHEGAGEHSCRCSDGYTGSGTECADTDGCAPSPCADGVACTDVPADAIGFNSTFICGACPDGFEGDGVICDDIDDCLATPCGNGTCTDEGVTAYSCACDFGYTFNDGVACVEIFPCRSSETNDCHEHATCNHESPGVHSCHCHLGYSGDGTSCTDTDGCVDSPCSDGVECTDVPAAQDVTDDSAYSCGACPSGSAGDGIICSDVDDCANNPCTAFGVCTDAGADVYECACDDGYTFAAGTCEEIFPCDLDEDDCVTDAVCNHEAPGQHSCTCTAGLEGDGTGAGSGCSDVDGCAATPCFADVACTDVAAPATGHTCGACPDGFSGDGEACQDIDDCAAAPCGGSGVCTDVGADAYECACDDGYVYDGETCTDAATRTDYPIDWIVTTYDAMTVAVGDTVTFNYNNYHNVYVHPSGTCERADATLLGDNAAGSVTYHFEAAGTVTFACQAGTHCEAGQIITITAGDATPCSLASDLDDNGLVNVLDILFLLGAFGGGAGGDVNGDLQTNVPDLLLLLSDFGLTC